MKNFNYSLDLDSLKVSDQEKALFKKESYAHYKYVFEQMLYMAVNSIYKDGIGGSKQRALGRILNKLDLADSFDLQLEDSEFSFLKEVFNSEEAKFPPQNTRLISQYQKGIDASV